MESDNDERNDKLKKAMINDINIYSSGLDSDFAKSFKNDEDVEEACKYKRLCVGRFHGAVAAACLGIPFSTWPSNTHKIQGLMKDMGVSHHHYDNKKDAMANVPFTLDPCVPFFCDQAEAAIHEMFQEIARL